jgi:hypothetical protein
LVWHAPAALQNWDVAQGALFGSQLPEHFVLSAHWLLLQVAAIPGRQLPAPSQVGAEVVMPFTQVGAPHVVAAAGNAQVVRFEPSHDPWQAPVPAHAARPVRGPPVTATQIPLLLGSPHDSHCPVHALSQQTPSTQCTLEQSPFALHGCPCLTLHPPAASQALVPEQVSGSSAPVTATHTPPPPVQAWHEPQDAVMQQWPSTQFPDWQRAFESHAPPAAIWLWQAPAPLQNWPVGQAAPPLLQPPAQRVASRHWPLAHATGATL